MKKTALFSIMILIAGVLTIGCQSTDLMAAKDKQPRVSCTPYAVPWKTPAVTGVPSFIQEYGMRVFLDKSGVFEVWPRQALNPVTITRFQLAIETYDITQEFKFVVEFPIVPFAADGSVVALPLENSTPIPISDGGRGPGGVLLVTVAYWGPPEAGPNAVDVSFAGVYPFKFIVTDEEGRDSVAYASVKVVETVIDKIKTNIVVSL